MPRTSPACLRPDDTAREQCAAIGDVGRLCVNTCIKWPRFASLLGHLAKDELHHIADAALTCSVDNLTFDASELWNVSNLAHASSELQRCGAIFVRELLPEQVVSAAHDAGRRFLANTSQLKAAYIELPLQAENTDEENRSGLPFAPNLRGGRFEVMPPMHDTSMSLALQAVAAGVVPHLLTLMWGSRADLFTFLLMSQANFTWNQPFHRDTHSVEEVKLQVALHDYGLRDGPPEFLLGSHCAAGMTVRAAEDLFSSSTRATVKAGDAIVYLSSVLHRGIANTARTVERLSFDAVLHSTNRFAHDSESMHLEHRPHLASSTNLEKLRAIWNTAPLMKLE